MTNAPSLWAAILDVMCSLRTMLHILLFLEIVFLLLALFSFAFVDTNSDSYVVLQLTTGFIVATLLGIGLAIHVCNRRHADL